MYALPGWFTYTQMVKGRQSRLGHRKPSRGSSWPVMLTLLATCSFLILILLALPILSNSNANSSGRLIIKPNDLNSIALNTTTHISEAEYDQLGERWVEIISWEPRIFLYHNFLTKEECEHLINIAKPNMRKSTVIESETGMSIESRVRTSSGTFLARGRDKIVRNIENRIADFTFIPVDNGEELQVLHYQVGEKYVPHHDYFMDDINTANGGDRIATMLMYLSDVEEGGETVFPDAKGNFSSMPGWNELSVCGKKGLSIKPKMRNALLFWSIKPDATYDPLSLHEPTEQKAIIKSLSFSLSFNNTNGESQTVFSAVASQIMVAGFVSGHAHSAAADLLLPHSHSSSSPHSLHSPCQCQLLRFSQHSHTKEECEYLINIATPHMQKSTVADNQSGQSVVHDVRKSTGAFLDRGQDEIVRNIEKRIADVTFIPIVGQYYDPHYDYFIDDFNIENGGQRIATMLMYLSNVEEGGETMFPRAKANFSSVPWWNELSNCGKMGLSIKPKMGDALLFWSMKPNATLDALTLHSACPVIKGNKWSCTKWMHPTEFKMK
ncbi:putative prolyl 4-hydroxylase 10 [Glycine soja]